MYFRDRDFIKARPITVHDAVSYGVPISSFADLEEEFPVLFPVLGDEDEGLFRL
ncbi:hypothetical protein [Rhizobium leguminosarum]|uniref:hypothetical protein n=1 Tax=Rhizobium leguminosarum TaxID=384 RepID=UPI00143F13FF|nr:hypothetical protein [Rhizobium leguminosarum]